MDTNALALISTIIGGLNLAGVALIVFKGGYWMGTVDRRLLHLEERRGRRVTDEP